MSSSQTDSGIRGLLERLLEGALTDDLIADGVIAESGAQAKELWPHPGGDRRSAGLFGLDQARRLGVDQPRRRVRCAPPRW